MLMFPLIVIPVEVIVLAAIVVHVVAPVKFKAAPYMVVHLFPEVPKAVEVVEYKAVLSNV